jgi:Domain of unknown function (DUF2341)
MRASVCREEVFVSRIRPVGRRRLVGAAIAIAVIALATPALASGFLRNFTSSTIRSTADVTAYNYLAATNTTYTTTADFNTGAYTNTTSATVANSVVLTGTTSAPWWNVSWSNRRCAVIDHLAAGATTVTEYPVRVLIDTAALITAGTLRTDGGDFRAISAAGAIVPFWLEGPINTTQTAVWVQVPTITAAASTSFCIYHGNAAATSVSDQLAVFSYTTAKRVFYPVSNRYTTNPTTAAAMSYASPTSATSGASTLTLTAGTAQTFPAAQVTPTGPVSVTKPISTRGTANGFDTFIPISAAGTSFVVPNTFDYTGTSTVSVVAPFAASTVTMTYLGVPVTGSPFSVPLGGTITASVLYTASGSIVLTATTPVLASHATSTGALNTILYPATTETLYGVATDFVDMGFTVAGTAGLRYSTGTLVTATGVAGDEIYYGGTAGGGGPGHGLAITPAVPIMAYPNSSNDAASFLPLRELSNMYRIPTAASYLTFACPTIGTTIRINLTVPVTLTCATTGAGPFPAGTPGKALHTGAVPAGTLIETTSAGLAPFYMYYANSATTGKETNVWGPKQSRQYTWPEPVVSFGGTGTWESPTIDTGVNGVFGTLSWNASVPPGTTLSFQVAASASATGPFTYVGPDGTAATTFSASPGAVPFSLDGLRYARVLASFASTSGSTPQLNDITIGANLPRLARSMEAVGLQTAASAAGVSVTTYLVRLKTTEAGLAGSTVNVTHRGGSTNLANLTAATVRADATAEVTVAAGVVTLASGPALAFDATNSRSILLVSQTAAAAQTTVLKTAINVDIGVAGGSPLVIFDLDVTIIS